MTTYKIVKITTSTGDRAEIALQDDLDNLRFLSMKQARGFAYHLLADYPDADFRIEKERHPGIYDARAGRVYLRQGSRVAVFRPSRLGFIDLGEVSLVTRDQMEPEIRRQWDRYGEIAAA